MKASRWSVLLPPSYNATGAQLFPPMMAGVSGNNLLPAHLGELISIYFVGKKFGIPKSTVLATLIVERLFDLIAVLILFSVALLVGDYSTKFYVGAIFLLAAAVAISIVSALLSNYTNYFVNFVERRFTFFSVDTRRKISEQIVNLSSGLQALRERRVYWRVCINSFLQWLLIAGCFYFSLLAFSIDVSPMIAIVILGFIVVGLTLPTSPGFFGTIEYCYVLALTAVGVDASKALSAAIYYHLPTWVVITISGLLLLRYNKVSFSQVRSVTE